MRFLREIRGWNIRYGTVWMVQWQLDWWLSFGVHLDPKMRRVSSGQFAGLRYGPYLDLHLGFVIVSVGWRPYLTGELVNESGIARGGESVPTDEELVVERIEWKWRAFVELALIVVLLLNIWATVWRVNRGGWLGM